MKITYAREKNQWALICFISGVLLGILAFLPAFESGWEIPKFARCLIVIFIFACGVYNARSALTYKIERRRIETEGTPCAGIITEVKCCSDMERKEKSTSLVARYNSKLVGKEVVFETPIISINIDGDITNIGCTVIEAVKNANSKCEEQLRSLDDNSILNQITAIVTKIELK